MDRNELCLQIKDAVNHFQFNGKPVRYERYGNGHINDTFKVTTEKGGVFTDYIVQRVNTDIFTDPNMLMNNIKLVTDYIRGQIAANGGDAQREVMQVIPTDANQLYYTDVNGSAWRAYLFVVDSVCLDAPRNTDDLEKSARAFGQFASTLAGFDAEKLGEPIPRFHDTPNRFANLMTAYNTDKCGRASEVKELIDFAKEREQFTYALQNSGVPLRVTHNDTKLNNILLDKDSYEALCVIDLDTIMPGYSANDFGDMIRFSANTAKEDEADLDKVQVNLELYEACVRGYIEGTGGGLTEQELWTLPIGAKMMTFECGMRFLTDYLEGDTYFRTAYDKHNLVRCLNQFKLLSELEKCDEQIKNIIQKYITE
ncbi:MAG: aminoglycoside phosphotransferase family protein [Clostridia bacterium]|nr:aminoglycoside phosphotransferase family protein [Clostridia bacterium]